MDREALRQRVRADAQKMKAAEQEKREKLRAKIRADAAKLQKESTTSSAEDRLHNLFETQGAKKEEPSREDVVSVYDPNNAVKKPVEMT